MPSIVALRRQSLRALKQRGYVVQVGALEEILAGYRALRDHFDGDRGLASFLEHIQDALSRCGGAPILSASDAAAAVKRVTDVVERSAGVSTNVLTLIDVFDIPEPPCLKRVGVPRKRPGSVIDSRPEAKAALFRARYSLLMEKTMRNPRFAPPSAALSGGVTSGRSGKSPYLQLTAIDSLQGCDGDRLILGMLTQMEEGSWFLEDLNGSIEVDLSEAHTTAGLHTESSFVIAQGRLVELEADRLESSRRLFKVFAMGTPPVEERDVSLLSLGKDVNVFGGSYDPSDEPDLQALEKESGDAMFVLFSDVHLDNPRVLSGLRVVFEGYLEDGVVPTAIVLMGSFLSHPFGQHSSDPAVLSAAFTALGEMIASDFPQIAESCHFVIVPGQHDLGPGNVLPRPVMPSILTDGFVAALSAERVLHGTNPCRLRYLTQEIVLFREDLLHKMLRNCAVKPDRSDTGVMAEHMIKSIVDQAHLCPLPLTSRPILWAHDHALWLFPSPHLVVVADKVDGYTFTYGSTMGMNPGSFGTDLSFAVYLPSERRSQQCTLDPRQLKDLNASRET